MKKKGQVSNQIGGMIMMAIAAIVGLILLVASAQNVGQTTDTRTLANYSIGTSPVESASMYLTEFRSISNPVIYNATGFPINANNYTITNNVVSPTGLLSVRITQGAINAQANDTWNISGTGYPVTYDDTSGRSITGVLVLLMALAIAVAVIGYAVRSGKFE